LEVVAYVDIRKCEQRRAELNGEVYMVKTLERALAEVARLPEAAQEKIGRELLAHVEKLQSLRETINRSIEQGGSYTEKEVQAAVADRLDACERKRK
jgi:hypothetical protein